MQGRDQSTIGHKQQFFWSQMTIPACLQTLASCPPAKEKQCKLQSKSCGLPLWPTHFRGFYFEGSQPLAPVCMAALTASRAGECLQTSQSLRQKSHHIKPFCKQFHHSLDITWFSLAISGCLGLWSQIQQRIINVIYKYDWEHHR